MTTTTPGPTGASADAVAKMIQALGLTIEDVAAVLQGQATTACTTTVGEYAVTALAAQRRKEAAKAGSLRGKRTGTSGTYGAPIMMAVTGLPGLCECRCADCATEPTCPCSGPDGQPGPCQCPGIDACTERWHGFGDKTFDAVLYSELESAVAWAQLRASKRNARRDAARSQAGRVVLERDGRGAAENAVAGLRWLWKRAITDGLATRNPTQDLTKPDRDSREPRAVDVDHLEELFAIATSTGRDPAGDALILWAFLVFGSRVGGMMNLTVGRLHVEDARGTVRELKTGKHHEAAITGSLAAALYAHAVDRGPRIAAPADADPEVRRSGVPDLRSDSPVFYRQPRDTFDADGNFVSREVRPVTQRSLECFRDRIKRNLRWADDIGLRFHDLRHTAGTLLERTASKAIAAAQLGHVTSGDSTDAYTGATFEERRNAIDRLWGAT